MALDFSNLIKLMEENNNLLKDIRTALTKDDVILENKDVTPEKNVEKVQTYTEHVETLEEALNSDAWPFAVDPELICNEDSEEDKEMRAEGIIEMMIDEYLEDLRFLDFGCGKGHVPMKALEQNPVISVGYDPKTDETWEKFPKNDKLLLTDNLQEVTQKGPYDVILIYDVLDHIVDPNDPVDVLNQAKDLLHPNGKLYVRCHPFSSRTGTHLYNNINKAYIHLAFTEIELLRLGYEPIPTRKILHPMKNYQEWFKQADLNEIYNNVIRESVEDYFEENKEICQKIKSNWSNSHEPALRDGIMFPRLQLEMQFVDFVLSKR